LATLAATGAFAQSSVTIKGTFDPSIANQQTTYGDNKSVTQQFVRNNTQSTSQITFYGTTDLGDGLKANFLYENDFDTRFDAYGAGAVNNGTVGALSGGVKIGPTNFGSNGGEQFLNLEGGFGKIALGAPNTPTLFSQSANPFGTKIGGGFGLLNSGKVRTNNTVMYSTPTMSGFTGHLAYSFKTTNDVNPTIAIAAVGDVTDIGLFYANGPLAVMFTSFKVSATSSAAGAALTVEKTDNNLTGTYDFGVAKLGFGYFTQKQGSIAGALKATDKTGMQVFATVPLSANLNLLANYGSVDDKTTAATNSAAWNLDSKITAVGVKYTLSKMTSIYARYVEQQTDNITAATTSYATLAKKQQTTAIGIQHNF
jgi:predicted porin